MRKCQIRALNSVFLLFYFCLFIFRYFLTFFRSTWVVQYIWSSCGFCECFSVNIVDQKGRQAESDSAPCLHYSWNRFLQFHSVTWLMCHWKAVHMSDVCPRSQWPWPQTLPGAKGPSVWRCHQRKMLNRWLHMHTTCTLVKDLLCQVPLVSPIQFSPLLTFMFPCKVGHRGGNMDVSQIKTSVIIIMIFPCKGKQLPGPSREENYCMVCLTAYFWHYGSCQKTTTTKKHHLWVWIAAEIMCLN